MNIGTGSYRLGWQDGLNSADDSAYLVWNIERQSWSAGRGHYTKELKSARRFTRTGAMRCCNAALARAPKGDSMPELPVRWDDAVEIVRIYCARRPDRTEAWM